MQESSGEVSVAPQATAAEIEAQQEALLVAKYGALPSRKHLLAKRAGRQCFDSADWALAKEGRAAEAPRAALERLPARLRPPPTPALPRRTSTLSMDSC